MVCCPHYNCDSLKDLISFFKGWSSHQGLVGQSRLILQLKESPLHFLLRSLRFLSHLFLAGQDLTFHLEEGEQFNFFPCLLFMTYLLLVSIALSLTFFRAFSSLAWAFICCTSMESTFLLRMKRSWLPMHNCRIWRENNHILIKRNVTQPGFGNPLRCWTNQLIHTQLRRVELENILLLIQRFDCELQEENVTEQIFLRVLADGIFRLMLLC